VPASDGSTDRSGRGSSPWSSSAELRGRGRADRQDPSGARAVDPSIRIRARYLSEPPDMSGFDKEILGFQGGRAAVSGRI